ncbi:Uncharacterized protein CLAVI_000643 [Candidatus Clavichlamydia salmonicola]|uniref:GNAT family N-acetyltransferase n=1 Tax=Candidatus Clavichlamydia salmonicola TaxID=469812 RepID=UPI001890EF73|nr:GNAT family protein [Candidatus Clavichlamydia salmonicola]MBF5051016.1 Uncharacterized protein [Candidatus Clavichlamydia salmonicola]
MSNLSKSEDLSQVKLRYSQPEKDLESLTAWLSTPEVQTLFPCGTPVEIADSAQFWLSFSRYQSSVTALSNDEPIGIGSLILMPYQKIAHHALVSLIVKKEWRNKGVGTLLLNNILNMAKETFRLESVCLEVYENNPAISLYKRFLFQEIGCQKRCLKYEGKYWDKIIMERRL